MAMIDTIMEQLQNLGIDTQGGYAGISNISPEQMASAFQSKYGLSASQLPSSLFQRISPDILKAGLTSTYSPMIETTGQNLLGSMLDSMAGKEGRQAAGGFAGSGQQQQFVSGIRDVYGKGMTDILAQTGQQRTKALSTVKDLIDRMQSQALQIKGY